MKILFIGGTGNISLASSQKVLAQGHELWLLNRSGASADLSGGRFIQADINDQAAASRALREHRWDVVVNWVAFTQRDVQRDVALFKECCQHYVFISSASCYLNPGSSSVITESRPLENPYWQYSRDKIAAERFLMSAYETQQFPVTIVRPSHTYSRVIPITIGGWTEYTTMARIKAGKPIVVQGDGNALWTITHAQDFARGFCGLLGKTQAIGEDFHITSDELLSWNQIYQQTAAGLGCEADIVHVTSDKICQLNPDYTGTLLGDKSVSSIFDNAKIKSFVPEYRALIPYAEGIKETLAWFEADISRQRIHRETDEFIERLIASVK